MVAILQKMSGAEKVLWLIRSANESFWGSFFYRNQAVAYLALIMISAAVLFFYHYNRSQRRAQVGGPHLLLFPLICLTFASICLALSRGGILFGGLFFGVFLLLALARFLFSFSLRNSLLLTLLAALLLGAGAYGAYRLIDFDAIEERFGDIQETIETADQDSRWMCTAITWEMAQENLVLGWGAGSWRYIFPRYQQHYP